MPEKSYVGMSLCYFCGEPKEVILDRRLRDTLSREAVYIQEPCDKCHEHMKQGIIVIEYNEAKSTFGEKPELYRTGAMHVLTEDCIRRWRDNSEPESESWKIFDKALTMRAVFLPDEFCKLVGLA